MQARFDRLISIMVSIENGEKVSTQKRMQQLRQLSEMLEDWGTAVYPDVSYEWYQNFKGHHILPYAGAWIDQPWWVEHDFRHWRILEQWHRINETLADISSLPSADEMRKEFESSN